MNTPPMYFGDGTRLGRPYAKDPSVVRFGGRYLLYYSLPPGETAPAWAVGIAESHDLIHWEQVGEMLPEAGQADENGLCAPGARVLGSQVHLFYQSYGNWREDAICHAVSGDGLYFTRDPSNPVFRPGGDWNAGRAIDADVFPVGDRLLLYYATRDPEMKVQMLGVAAASLQSDFGRGAWTNLSTDGPMLAPTLPWEQDCLEAPTVCRHGDRLYLFYAGAYNNAPQQIGVAVGTDGVHWTRLSNTPLLPSGPPGAWNSSESGHPDVFVDDDGQTYLFYQGNSDGGHTWLLSVVRLTWQSGLPQVVTN